MEPIRVKNLEVRLAHSLAELDAARTLTYHVFHSGMVMSPNNCSHELKRDVDDFDQICDHLIVIDTDRSAAGRYVVATCRLLRGRVAKRHSGFDTEREFNLESLRQYPGEIMELSRACIDGTYRGYGAMQLLWRGVAAYILAQHVELMFGRASLFGTNLAAHRLALSYLHNFHRGPRHLRPEAVPDKFISMELLKKKTIDCDLAWSRLPPLLKGYLRLGGTIGDGAVLDHQFNTVDVCVMVETPNVTDKYAWHFLDGTNHIPVIGGNGFAISA
jgi:L-ornithine Nalpha-acyltransferase